MAFHVDADVVARLFQDALKKDDGGGIKVVAVEEILLNNGQVTRPRISVSFSIDSVTHSKRTNKDGARNKTDAHMPKRRKADIVIDSTESLDDLNHQFSEGAISSVSKPLTDRVLAFQKEPRCFSLQSP